MTRHSNLPQKCIKLSIPNLQWHRLRYVAFFAHFLNWFLLLIGHQAEVRVLRAGCCGLLNLQLRPVLEQNPFLDETPGMVIAWAFELPMKLEKGGKLVPYGSAAQILNHSKVPLLYWIIYG